MPVGVVGEVPVGVVGKDITTGAEALRFLPGPVKSATVATAATFMCCRGVKPLKWIHRSLHALA